MTVKPALPRTDGRSWLIATTGLPESTALTVEPQEMPALARPGASPRRAAEYGIRAAEYGIRTERLERTPNYVTPTCHLKTPAVRCSALISQVLQGQSRGSERPNRHHWHWPDRS